MKKIILSVIISIITATSFAQNNIGIGTNAPNTSAALDITSTNKGLLIPRMTTAQRTAIATTATGLMVFDTDTNSFWYYSGSAWSSMSGSSSLTLPFQQTVTSAGNAFDISNLGTGGALKGVSNTATGIGVYGETANGNGVKGYANNAGSIGVFGSSLSGTGVKATSFTGLALDVIGNVNINGNVKISGGNTNPSQGAVLTSDAQGNAVWKSQKIAFSARLPGSQSMPYSLARVKFDNVSQTGGGLNTNSSATDPNVFVAPVSGTYYFSASTMLRITSATTNIFQATIIIGIVGTSNGFTYGRANKSNNEPGYSEAFVSAQGLVRLSAGTKVEVTALANNTGDLPSEATGSQFDGFLIFAD